MVNLVAERAIVPELMQDRMTGERLAAEALWLLQDDSRARPYAPGSGRSGRRVLPATGEAMAKAAALVEELMEGQAAHVS